MGVAHAYKKEKAPEVQRQAYKTRPDSNTAQAQAFGNKLHPGRGTVLSDEAPLTPEQQFEQERRALNPLVEDTAVINPYVDTDHRTQRAAALLQSNTDLARKAYGMIPGQDDYTIKPTDFQQMEWSPDEKYAYEDEINQKRSDTRGLDAQRAALSGYDDIVNQGGLTAIDRAAIAESQQGREQELRGNREAIMQNAQEQGRAGGNAQLLSQMQAAQGTGNQRAMDDIRTNALALSRKDSALGSLGDLGGQVQTSQDSIDRFNAEGNRSRQERNVIAKNRGIDTKYNDEQQTRSSNTQLANSAEERNKSAEYGARGRYGDQVAAIGDLQNQNEIRAAAETGRQASIIQQRQQKAANVIGGIGAVTGAATGAVQTLAPYVAPKEKEKAR